MRAHAAKLAFAAAAAAASVVLAVAPAALADDLGARFARLTRAGKWVQVAAVPVPFPTFHPQGLAAAGDALFVSSVEIVEPTRRFPAPRDGHDRTPGKGRGHLFKMGRDGRLLGRAELGEGDAYHPGGIDHDGRWLWVPVAEYRPGSASIVYRVDPETLAATEVLRVRDHIGGVVFDPERRMLHGVSWGSRRFYAWQLDDRLEPQGSTDRPPEPRPNPSHYVDYQDCAYVAPGRMLCSGVAEHRPPDPSAPKWSLGGLDLVDLAAGRPVHQVPVLLWTASGEAMARNPSLVEPTPRGLRALFMPEDDRSTLYTYEVALD